jgi:hypothetical protein
VQLVLAKAVVEVERAVALRAVHARAACGRRPFAAGDMMAAAQCGLSEALLPASK